jgi:hypothetical protein
MACIRPYGAHVGKEKPARAHMERAMSGFAALYQTCNFFRKSRAMTEIIAQNAALYDADYYEWTLEQAALLRGMTRRPGAVPLDFEHLAEEVEDLGREQLHAAESRTVRTLEHLLKLEHSPAAGPRYGWMRTIVEARHALARKLTPSIERKVRAALPDHYAVARRLAALALAEHGEHDAAAALPADCPYTFDQIRAQDWYPPNRHGMNTPPSAES